MDFTDIISGPVEWLVKLTPTAIFATIAIAEGWYIKQVHKDAVDSNEKWRGTREKQIAAEVEHTEAIKQMSQKISSLEMAFMKYLINKE